MYIGFGERRKKYRQLKRSKQFLKSAKRQSTDSRRLKGVKKNKAHNGRKFIENVYYAYYCVFFEFFDFEGAKYRETFHYIGC